MNIRALVAEAVGTFILVFMGSLGIATVFTLVGEMDPVIAQLYVPFTFGLGLLAAIAIGGHVSGGHFNPAVTLGALFDGRVTPVSAVGYVVAQIIGALGASLLLLLLTSPTIVAATVNQPGATGLGGAAQDLRAFSVEVILTAIFVAVILTVTRKQPNAATFVIPLVLLVIHFAAIPISGASVNPVRSLAPAVVSGTYASLWVYLTAPFVGAVIGWGLYRFLTPADDEEYDEGDDGEVLDDDLAELDEIDEDDDLTAR
jgi:aquaporin Z